MDLADYAISIGIDNADDYHALKADLDARAQDLFSYAISLHKTGTGIYWPIEELGLIDSPEDLYVLYAMKKLGLETYAGSSWRI